MKSKLLAMLLMAGSTMFAGVRFGIGVPAAVVVAPVIPPCPGPGYIWSGGIWVAPRGFYGGPRYYGRPGFYGGHAVYHGYARGYRR